MTDATKPMSKSEYRRLAVQAPEKLVALCDEYRRDRDAARAELAEVREGAFAAVATLERERDAATKRAEAAEAAGAVVEAARETLRAWPPGEWSVNDHATNDAIRAYDAARAKGE